MNINVEVHAGPGMDEEALAEKIKRKITDPTVLKRIAGDRVFLKAFDRSYGGYYVNEARRSL